MGTTSVLDGVQGYRALGSFVEYATQTPIKADCVFFKKTKHEQCF